MKKSQNLILLSIVIGLITIIFIITVLTLQNESFAATCSTCGGTLTYWKSSTTHYLYCAKCDQQEGSGEAHTINTISRDATCNNPGVRREYCTVCGYELLNETIPATGVHDWNPTTGTCRSCGKLCTHTGGTHANGGKCTTCGYKYQNHGKDTTVAGYEQTETGHKAKYKCTEATCTETYEGDEEAHTGGTHANEGKCTVCEAKYQNHGKGTTVAKYEQTETGHKAKYKCTEATCTETYEGDEETHTITTWTDNGNGTHSGTCDKCNQNVTEDHKYGTDDKCKDCGTTKPATDCEHNWQDKSDETNHWEECTKCGEIKNKEKHTVTNWKNNGDGTHSGTCDKCNRTIKGNHNKGTDGKCTDCKTTISDNNNNNNNGNNTSGGKVIPNTGKGTAITIGITATVALLGMAAVGLKKYKDIA